MRSLKDLGNVGAETFNTRNDTKKMGNMDVRAFQEGMELKDKELCDMRIKLNSLKASMTELNQLVDDLRSQNNKFNKELEVEKQKNSTKVLERQLNKLKKEILKKDRDIDEYRKLVDQLKEKMYNYVDSN